VDTVEEKNARITGVSFGYEDHGILTCTVGLDYGGSGQSFGGYALDTYDKEKKKRIGTAFGTQFILEILRVLDIRTWEKLPGVVIRVRASHNKVHAIGHALKDQWFTPAALIREMLPHEVEEDALDEAVAPTSGPDQTPRV
jgi:hypothetical protein